MFKQLNINVKITKNCSTSCRCLTRKKKHRKSSNKLENSSQFTLLITGNDMVKQSNFKTLKSITYKTIIIQYFFKVFPPLSYFLLTFTTPNGFFNTIFTSG